jgi:Zn ribbon nucleic-acid-binding protein
MIFKDKLYAFITGKCPICHTHIQPNGFWEIYDIKEYRCYKCGWNVVKKSREVNICGGRIKS